MAMLNRWQTVDSSNQAELDRIKQTVYSTFTAVRIYVSTGMNDERMDFFYVREEACLHRPLQEQVIILNKLAAIYTDDKSVPTVVLLAAKILHFGFCKWQRQSYSNTQSDIVSFPLQTMPRRCDSTVYDIAADDSKKGRPHMTKRL